MSNFSNYKKFENVGIRSSNDTLIIMNSSNNNISLHSSDGGEDNVDTLSIKNIINKTPNMDLNLSSLNENTINPVITINNNHSDCRIMTNLNVSGNLNIGAGTLNIGTNIQFYNSGSHNYLTDPSAPGNNKWKLYWKEDSTHTILGSGDANGTTSLAVAGIEVLTAKGNNVGINKTDPSYPLDVNGDIRMSGGDFYSSSTLYIRTTSGSIVFWPGNNDAAQFTTDKKLKINKSGTPLANLHIGNGNLYTYYNYGGFYGADAHTYADSNTERGSICAIFDKVIKAEAYVAASDSRIKTNIVDVPDNLALQQLRSIPCRYYEYIDKVARGPDKTIGFIAQEVKTIMPMATIETQSIIPNVYKIINCVWTSVNDKFNMSSSDLPNVSGVTYQFYVSNTSDYSDEKEIELTGNSDNTFTFDSQYTNVFCYGSEVDDFHTIDKTKLFALNFSASQELDRIQQTHITEIASLKAENEQQQTKINELTSIIDKLKTANSFEDFKNSL